ncbi:MAG: hypothetical protein ACXVBE_16135 [Bdellovibrionota bacterium]
MPYEVYKVMHLVAIFIFLSGAAVLLLSKTRSKFWTITTGVASFFILLAGMGLVARLQVGFPPWVVAKMVIWLVVTGLGHIVAKRFSAYAMQAYWLTIILAGTAATLAVYKP